MFYLTPENGISNYDAKRYDTHARMWQNVMDLRVTMYNTFNTQGPFSAPNMTFYEAPEQL